MSSRFRTEIRQYYIYCILDEIFETVFVGKSYGKKPISHYYSHMRGEHALTKDAYIDADITEPKFIILEIIHCTGRIAFKHVLAWYNYFEEQGYAILTDEKAGHMVDNMSQETKEIYDNVCAPYTLYEVLTRKVGEPLAGQQKNEEKRGKEALVQFNMRIKECVAQAYRAFCIERGITQSEGLRLLLLGEDFANRDLMMQSYQQELNALKAENSKLKEQNKDLLALQKEKESWALHHRNEWIRITKDFLKHVVDMSIMPLCFYVVPKKPLGIKSAEGYALFSSHQYPSAAGCFEVTLEARIWGFSRSKTTPDHDIPLFICGVLKDHTPIKFRWYPKQPFIGIYPSDHTLACWGTSWLMGCVIAKDGAANLVCAVPLRGINQPKPLLSDIETEILATENERETSSVNELIAAADRKRIKN